jgi:hypothetical protein
MSELIFRSFTVDELLERVKTTETFKDLSDDVYNTKLQDLLRTNQIESALDNNNNITIRLPSNFARDKTHFNLKIRLMDNLTMTIIHNLIKKEVYLWTIILGAQKTKTAQAINRLRYYLELLENPDHYKTVPVMFLKNDLDLKDQATTRIIKDILVNYNVKLFICASKAITLPAELRSRIDDLENKIICNPKQSELEDYIELYSQGSRTAMPILISLPNPTQVKKVEKGVYNKITTLSNIKHVTFVDEADEVWPQIRDKLIGYICIEGSNVPTEYNDGIYFITASHDEFLEDPRYPEVRDAEQLPIILDEGVEVSYRDVSHEESIHPVGNLRQKQNESNGDYARRVLSDYRKHFFTKINGVYRRTIVHADFENEKQLKLARDEAARGFGCIVINQNGFRVLYPLTQNREQPHERVIRSSELKGKQLNEKLLSIYMTHPELSEGPLLVIGHRKISRALTYHSAPRDPKDINSLIFNDIIVGHIEVLKAAVQILGRLYGVIGHRPDYCKNLWFWVDQRTYEMVMRQVQIVKHIQENSIIPRPIVDLDSEARAVIPEESLLSGRDIREIGPFNTYEECRMELSNKLGRNIQVDYIKDLADRSSYKTCSRLTLRENGEYIPLANRTLRHRLIRKRVNSDIEGGIIINTIGPGTCIDRSNGNRVNQNFIILPEYENESSIPDQVKFSARYEMPMIDINNVVLFNGDIVMYDNIEYTIHTITYSKDGVPTRATLEKNGLILALDEKEVDILGENLMKL